LVVSLIAERDEMDGRAPTIIVLTLAAGALGGPDALRALLDLAERSPLVDIAICLLVTAMVTAQLLGVALLTRFVRKPRARAQPRWARGWEVQEEYNRFNGYLFIHSSCISIPIYSTSFLGIRYLQIHMTIAFNV
jgi:hypothetical protein